MKTKSSLAHVGGHIHENILNSGKVSCVQDFGSYYAKISDSSVQILLILKENIRCLLHFYIMVICWQ